MLSHGPFSKVATTAEAVMKLDMTAGEYSVISVNIV